MNKLKVFCIAILCILMVVGCAYPTVARPVEPTETIHPTIESASPEISETTIPDNKPEGTEATEGATQPPESTTVPTEPPIVTTELTINASTISMAVKAGNFGKSWDEAKTYSVYRYKMPWESDTISFTQTEIQQFFDLLCEDKTNFRCYNLPFKYHNYSTGWSFDIDEKESHIEWSNRT